MHSKEWSHSILDYTNTQFTLSFINNNRISTFHFISSVLKVIVFMKSGTWKSKWKIQNATVNILKTQKKKHKSSGKCTFWEKNEKNLVKCISRLATLYFSFSFYSLNHLQFSSLFFSFLTKKQWEKFVVKIIVNEWLGEILLILDTLLWSILEEWTIIRLRIAKYAWDK